MGGGGYVAGPVGFAALTRRIPLVLTEADSHLGLSNRLLAPCARRVCLSFPIEGRSDPRYRVTGRPIPTHTSERTSARLRFGIAAGRAVCARLRWLARGSHDQSRRARRVRLRCLPRRARVRAPRPCRSSPNGSLPPGYDLREYLDIDEFTDALAASDLVVARAGGSVFEIAAHGLPAILVPYPHASADHQSANARWMAQAGAAIVIEDARLTAARLAREVAAATCQPGPARGDGKRLASPRAARRRS